MVRFMSINNVNSNGLENMYSSIFGTGSSSNSSSGYSISDYSMISNGSYRKLMKAYYTMDKEDATDTGNSADKEDSTEKLNHASVKNNAAALNNALEDLRKSALYTATGKDEDGKTEYNRDKITSAVKSFVDSYNAYIDAADDSSSKGILRKTVNITKNTSKNSGMLSNVGITVGEGNKLILDEEKLAKADINKLSSLFTGASSYGDHVQTLARSSYQLANSLAYNGSSYSSNGAYALMGGGSISLDRYL